MNINLNKMLIPLGVFISVTLSAIILRGILLRYIHLHAVKTKSKIDDIIFSALKSPSLLWCIALGIYIGIEVSELPIKYVIYLKKFIHIVIIFSITLATSNIFGEAFKNYVHQANLPIPTTGLTYGILKGTIIIIGILIILSHLGISITPLLTALGIGGLAVALALKDTLSNLFAGLHILIEKSIRVGDFIKLETGQEGHVLDITWRTTRIKMLQNNIVIIPNSILAQSIVTNYYLPEKRMTLFIPISVSYSSDPEKIEKILLEITKKSVGEIPGLLEEPEPSVRFVPGFGESSLDFTIVCHISEITEQYYIQHELRKRIFKRFKEEGIEIPFPQRTIYLRKEKE